MFAVFDSGGKQHRVSEGEVVELEKLRAEPGSEVVFDSVKMIADGEDVRIGSPFIEGGKVTGTVVNTFRSKKVSVVKFKRRKNYLRKGSHRQQKSLVYIKSITG